MTRARRDLLLCVLVACSPPQAAPVATARATSKADAIHDAALPPVDSGITDAPTEEERPCLLQLVVMYAAFQLQLPSATDGSRWVATFCRNGKCIRSTIGALTSLRGPTVQGPGAYLAVERSRVFGIYQAASADELRDGDIYELRLERPSDGVTVSRLRQAVLYRDTPRSRCYGSYRLPVVPELQ
jgi:hypothetical protein